MLYRVLLILITGFFITMWTLLIRSEVQPGGNSLRAVPVEHVLREVFLNEKSSQLLIHDGHQTIGNLRLNGRPEAPDGSRTLEFFGSVQLTLPNANPQRSAWSGEIVVTRDWEIQSFNLSSATREITRNAGAATQLDFTLSPLNKVASYTLKSGGELVDEQTFTLDEAGLNRLLDHLGVDQMWLKQLKPGHGPKPELTARQASLVIDNMKIETWLLTVVVNGQTLIEAHVSQLGEVLQARTIFGWTLDVR